MDINKPPSFEGWLHMKIVLYVLKVLFFFGFYASFVFVNETMDVVLTEFYITVLRCFVIVLCGLDLISFLYDFLVILLNKVVKS